jgi:hypothetical protein
LVEAGKNQIGKNSIASLLPLGGCGATNPAKQSNIYNLPAMKTTDLLCKKARQIDLVEYLASLGYCPAKIKAKEYWYHSPFRNERTPSFKVNTQRNLWFDFGEGKGGDIIDFGVRYFNCSIQELLQRLSSDINSHRLSFHPHSIADSTKQSEESKITILIDQPISSVALQNYLQQRSIPLKIAQTFCRQVEYELNGRSYTAIGFPNDKGGYELRNAFFKGSSSPKSPSLIKGDNDNEVLVFEGFFNLLSYLTLRDSCKEDHLKMHGDYLVLNSLSFFEKSRGQMEGYSSIHLFLDRDKSGLQATQKALNWSAKYKDQSTCYHNNKDLNNHLIKKMQLQEKQTHRRGLHL